MFLIAQNRLFILVNQASLLLQECLLPIAVNDGMRNELLVMAAQGAVVSSCGISCMRISISKSFVRNEIGATVPDILV